MSRIEGKFHVVAEQTLLSPSLSPLSLSSFTQSQNSNSSVRSFSPSRCMRGWVASMGAVQGNQIFTAATLQAKEHQQQRAGIRYVHICTKLTRGQLEPRSPLSRGASQKRLRRNTMHLQQAFPTSQRKHLSSRHTGWQHCKHESVHADAVR